MKSDFFFGKAIKLEERREEVERFIKAIVDPDEYPCFVSDSASTYDISLLSSEELILRIKRAYGVCVTEKELSIPIWQLLDCLKSGIREHKLT